MERPFLLFLISEYKTEKCLINDFNFYSSFQKNNFLHVSINMEKGKFYFHILHMFSLLLYDGKGTNSHKKTLKL